MKVQYRGQELELPEKSVAKDLAKTVNQQESHQALAARVNHSLCDLSVSLNEGDVVDLIDFDSPEGKEVFWHTSAHLLAQAVLRLWPEAQLTIGPPIEQGFYYDFANLHISEEAIPAIEKEVKKILGEGLEPKRFSLSSKKEALQAFGSNPFKKELIEGFDENSSITAYRQGDFFDLCRGPHLPTLSKIKGFKILKMSGSYWRGDANREKLTRIYGISFPSRERLSHYLKVLEEAKKRDHRLLGASLNLFSFHEAAPAIPFFHPKGVAIWDHLLSYWKEVHLKGGYSLIQTPQLMSKELWERSGHWEHYRSNMFIVPLGEQREAAMKPMNCPGCMLYFKASSHSYRELPLRIAEVGHVHRKEPSGALSGLFRVQSFHQDDAHIFLQPSQLKEETLAILALVKQIYQTFGLSCAFELSTRPEKSIGTDRDWEVATAGLQEALDAWKEPYQINRGDGAFYGPKIDLHVRDALGRRWQCGTVQLDLALPEKFELTYKDRDGTFKRPVMIHRAIFGSIERFLGILIEHFEGKFPLWMSPMPIRLIPVAKAHLSYAKEVMKKIQQAGLVCDWDISEESLGKRVRNAQMEKINYMLTIGDREVANQTVALRTRDNALHGEVQIAPFLEACLRELQTRQLQSPYQKEAL